MAEKLLTAPTSEPVTLAEAKDHIIVTHGDSDAEIARKLKAAVLVCEKYCCRAFIEQTWIERLDAFEPLIYLPRSPLITVDSITYIDTDGTEQTLAAELYQVDTISEPPRICPAYGEVWPQIRPGLGAVSITYKAGYEATDASPPDPAGNVPQDIKDAILLVFTDLMEVREMQIMGGSVHMSATVETLLFNHRVRPVLS